MPTTAEILQRIDSVLKENRKTEWLFITCTVVLFCLGIACIAIAIATRYFVWSTPSVVTTGLLYWPLREIKDIRRKNIALATAPMLIALLPKAKAAEQIQKLLENLYGESQ